MMNASPTKTTLFPDIATLCPLCSQTVHLQTLATVPNSPRVHLAIDTILLAPVRIIASKVCDATWYREINTSRRVKSV